MISSLIESLLLGALVLTAGLVGLMYRELRRQGDYRRQYARILSETSQALSGIDQAVQDLHSDGKKLLVDLNTRIEEAREVAAEVEALVGAAKLHSPFPAGEPGLDPGLPSGRKSQFGIADQHRKER